MSQTEKLQLHQGLKNFGLNPAEWILVRLNRLHFAIFAKSNPDLVFAGPVQKLERGWDWVHLEFVEV